MLDEPDDPLKEAPQAPRPVIVVQVRRSVMSRLFVPTLVLIAAIAILSHRMRIDDWRGFTAFAGEERPEVVKRALIPPRAVANRPMIRPPTASTPASEAVKVALARSPAPPIKPRPMALRPRSGRVNVTLAWSLDRAKTAEEVWAQIRRDVDEVNAKTVAMEDLKKRAFLEDQRTQKIRAAKAAQEEIQKAEDSRAAFRKDLRRALAKANGQAGSAIEEVCLSYGLRLSADRVMGTAMLAETHSAGRRDRVERLRTIGMTESAIFVDLVRLEARNRVARGGPKTRQEVLIRAARQLLAIPLSGSVAASE